MKEGCFLDERFKIQHFNSSSGYPTLTVNGTDLAVTYISVDNSMIYVNQDRNTVVDLEGSPFVFSSENYFVATGCNNLALMHQSVTKTVIPPGFLAAVGSTVARRGFLQISRFLM
uniref:Uncharacterized protein n=1 Tax=Salix viminalis TaxID=40686 RepID=A0A6N2KQ91_SALVM